MLLLNGHRGRRAQHCAAWREEYMQVQYDDAAAAVSQALKKEWDNTFHLHERMLLELHTTPAWPISSDSDHEGSAINEAWEEDKSSYVIDNAASWNDPDRWKGPDMISSVQVPGEQIRQRYELEDSTPLEHRVAEVHEKAHGACGSRSPLQHSERNGRTTANTYDLPEWCTVPVTRSGSPCKRGIPHEHRTQTPIKDAGEPPTCYWLRTKRVIVIDAFLMRTTHSFFWWRQLLRDGLIPVMAAYVGRNGDNSEQNRKAIADIRTKLHEFLNFDMDFIPTRPCVDGVYLHFIHHNNWSTTDLSGGFGPTMSKLMAPILFSGSKRACESAERSGLLPYYVVPHYASETQASLENSWQPRGGIKNGRRILTKDRLAHLDHKTRYKGLSQAIQAFLDDMKDQIRLIGKMFAMYSEATEEFPDMESIANKKVGEAVLHHSEVEHKYQEIYRPLQPSGFKTPVVHQRAPMTFSQQRWADANEGATPTRRTTRLRNRPLTRSDAEITNVQV